MTASKSSRDIVQKYNKRLLKQHKENRLSTNMRLNYTTVTQLTENYDWKFFRYILLFFVEAKTCEDVNNKKEY
jgi:hypothetical protein